MGAGLIAFFLPETLHGTHCVIDYFMIKSRLFWIISAIFVFVILIILNYNENSIKLSPSLQTSSMENLYLKHKEGDKVKWELSSDKAVLPLGNKEVFLDALVLKINQTPEIYLTSGSGTYEIEEGNVTLNKSVELKIKDAKFATDSLKWNSKEELITTDDEIKLSGNSFLITGTGLSAKIQDQQVRIIKDVTAIFYR
jgi:LPS export ABC transporter protein LptC